MIPTRIQRLRVAGYRQPQSVRFCGRPSMFGNPFTIASHGPNVVGMHAAWLAGDGPECVRHGSRIYDRGAVMGRLPELAVYDHLSCFCPVCQPCHVDTLLVVLAGMIG